MALPNFAPVVPADTGDGTTYCAAAALGTSEADLGSPFVLPFGQALVAEVKLVGAGTPDTQSAYVVLQGDFGGDGNWFDLAWCLLTTVTPASYFFLLSAGVGGAIAVAQSRASGTAPGSSAANQCPLPGRLRFVGKATFVNGTTPSVKATIVYRVLGLR